MALAISRTLGDLQHGKTFRKLTWVQSELEKAGLNVDYVECVDAETLKPLKSIRAGACVLVAAYAGKTRLIDNVEIKERKC